MEIRLEIWGFRDRDLGLGLGEVWGFVLKFDLRKSGLV